MDMEKRSKAIYCIVLSALGFAVMGALVRLADEVGAPINPIQKAVFRNLVAVIIAVGVFMGERRRRVAAPPAAVKLPWWLLFWRSAFGTAGIFLNFYALSHIGVAEALALNKLAPFFTVLFAAWFLREKFAWRQLCAVGGAFIGALFIVKPFCGAFSAAAVLGAASGLCAGAAYTAVRALGRSGVSSALVVLFFSIFSTIASLPYTICAYDPMNTAQILTLLGAGAGATLGQFGITLAYRFAPPNQIAAYDYTNLIFGAIFGYFLFGQIPDAYSVLGMCLIVLCALRK